MDFQVWPNGIDARTDLAQGPFLPIVPAEYGYGISQSRNRKHYEQWLAAYLPAFRILDVDERTTPSYSAVRTELSRAGRPVPFQ